MIFGWHDYVYCNWYPQIWPSDREHIDPYVTRVPFYWHGLTFIPVWIKGLIMDSCVLLTSTPKCVVSPRGEIIHSGIDVNKTHLSMINPDYNMMPAIFVRTNQYSAYQNQI